MSMRTVLGERSKQPGHDRRFTASEHGVEEVCRAAVPAEVEVCRQPRELRDLFQWADRDAGLRAYGVQPDLGLRHRETGRVLYVEAKRQDRRGNAHERAARHYTPGFVAELRRRTEMPYHAYATVFCDALAHEQRYAARIPFLVAAGHWATWDAETGGTLEAFLDGWARVLAAEADTPPGADPAVDLPATLR